MTGDHPRKPVVLIVDHGLPQNLTAQLEAAGYIVWHASSGAAARQVVQLASRAQMRPDLVLIHDALPDVDCHVLAAFLRARTDAPIILCISGSRLPNRAILYYAGADGYLAWPPDRDELHALLQTLLRRAAPPPARRSEPQFSPAELRVGSLLIDVRRHTVLLGATRLVLSPAEFRLLVTLARQANTLVPISDLGRALWGSQCPNGAEALIANQVARLRARLRTSRCENPPSIVNAQSRGYRLLAA